MSIAEGRSRRDRRPSAAPGGLAARLSRRPAGVPLVPRRGPTIALMGPDGAGKSTVASGLRERLPVPVDVIYMGISVRGSGHGQARPVALPARVPLNWLRWSAAMVHALRGHVVVFDRYPFDAMLPAAGGQPAVRRAMRWIVAHSCPRPDVTVLLDVPADEMYRRKPEHPVEVLERRRQQYLELSSRLPRVAVIDADRAPDDVVRSVAAVVSNAHRRGRGRRDDGDPR